MEVRASNQVRRCTRKLRTSRGALPPRCSARAGAEVARASWVRSRTALSMVACEGQLVMVILSFVTPSVVLQSSLKILSNPHNSRKRLRLLLHGLTVVVVMVSLIPFSRQTRCGDPQLSAHVEAARVVHVNDRKQRWSPEDDYHRACIPLVRDSGEHSAHSHRNVAQNTSQAPPRRLDLDPKVSLRR